MCVRGAHVFEMLVDHACGFCMHKRKTVTRTRHLRFDLLSVVCAILKGCSDLDGFPRFKKKMCSWQIHAEGNFPSWPIQGAVQQTCVHTQPGAVKEKSLLSLCPNAFVYCA